MTTAMSCRALHHLEANTPTSSTVPVEETRRVNGEAIELFSHSVVVNVVANVGSAELVWAIFDAPYCVSFRIKRKTNLVADSIRKYLSSGELDRCEGAFCRHAAESPDP
eukprot:CAMPEP_0173409706 /NCGR_PEP_ID=MMETSP1356-20130122/72840_1 /TAXON_ID=77927 ORGANISM="Hemiselmis virescens, Strain PCC157" /NCGR_SAMPLE_ID=MMETSP1356 /ASSEMBLY_ACC=CAM_ASM_000847 /LENGTH=108 /DNA_ID=CAMNT_0014371229 /DNA_START=393 /DNA_END=720 /DNA_ORIENTATION=+